MSGSDTESESEFDRPASSFLFTHCLNEVETDDPKTISFAMQEICRVGLMEGETIAKDANIHDAISAASTIIVSFLDSVNQVSTKQSQAQRLLDFGALSQESFLMVMFELRKVFYKIAAQSLASDHESASSGPIVCWVDAILVKLGDTSIAIASGVSLDLITPLFPGSAEYNTQDGLRAASQLPSEWHSVPAVMALDHASPGAKRLALRLTFAVFVLGPRLCQSLQSKIPCNMIEILDRCVNQTRAAGFSASRAGDLLAIQERLNFAMIVSLFAVTDREYRNFARGSHLRPHSLGCLLNMLQNVIHPEDSVSSLQLLTPPEDLDPAQNVLFWSPDTIYWCWETWDDHRVADAESIVFLTSMWLLHSEKYFEGDGIDNYTSTSAASSIAVLRVLHHIGRALSMVFPTVTALPVSTTVISAACSNATKSLKYLASVQNDDERWIISGLSKCLLGLFVVLGAEFDAERSAVEDHILEALSLVDADTLHICLTRIQEDNTLRFSARLDERLICVRKLLSPGQDMDSQTQEWKLNLVRSALNFAAILSFSQTRGILLRQSVSRLLSHAIEFLLQKNPDSLRSKILGDAILTAASASRNDPSQSDENQESIWEFAITTVSSELRIASSFAHYIIKSDSLCNPLYCAESWRCLGEVLLLILKRHYIEEEEPLALLVCPTVCAALLRLLHTDAASLQFMLSTPVTLNICAELKYACESPRLGDYFAVMKKQLDTIGPSLLKQIIGKSQNAMFDAPLDDFSTRPIFYRMYGVSHLVFVPDL
ncbi:hypothetical protein C8R43DRAFT_1044748 [Mycena crocata]|nr:hypothetical protein C8R43DRAFT_1044748 [Mycena crocata]